MRQGANQPHTYASIERGYSKMVIDDGSLIMLAGAAAFVLFWCFFGGLFFASPYESTETPETPQQSVPRVYVYDVIDGEYTIDDAPVAMLEARHDA